MFNSLSLFILQTTPVAQKVAPAQTLTWLDLIWAGGWVMIPIIVLSVVTFIIFIERFLTLRKALAKENFIDFVRRYLQSGDVRGAVAYCSSTDKPVAQVIKRGLDRIGRPIGEIQEVIQVMGKNEMYNLEKRLQWLATIAGIQPMLGFLGTASGMIEVFQKLQGLQGQFTLNFIAGGVWTALVATAMGLTTSIIAQLAYNLLVDQFNKVLNQMERFSADFVDLLQEPVPTAQTVQPQFQFTQEPLY